MSARTDWPGSRQAGSGSSTRVPGALAGLPAGSTRGTTGRPSTPASVTVSEEPAREMVGLFGQARNTSSHVGRSGVKTTAS